MFGSSASVAYGSFGNVYGGVDSGEITSAPATAKSFTHRAARPIPIVRQASRLVTISAVPFYPCAVSLSLWESRSGFACRWGTTSEPLRLNRYLQEDGQRTLHPESLLRTKTSLFADHLWRARAKNGEA
jgi:hypothetical protein